MKKEGIGGLMIDIPFFIPVIIYFFYKSGSFSSFLFFIIQRAKVSLEKEKKWNLMMAYGTDCNGGRDRRG